jgi:hypothetical protein
VFTKAGCNRPGSKYITLVSTTVRILNILLPVLQCTVSIHADANMHASAMYVLFNTNAIVDYLRSSLT